MLIDGIFVSLFSFLSSSSSSSLVEEEATSSAIKKFILQKKKKRDRDERKKSLFPLTCSLARVTMTTAVAAYNHPSSTRISFSLSLSCEGMFCFFKSKINSI